MRALRVLGLAEDGENLVCEDGTSGELFTVPADERLRAAIRGDLSRLGQLEIELEPQLRPREIQARIRAGSSIVQVAAAAQTSVGRIERYAYPVLLERSTMAEKARQSHPMIDGNPARKTLEELVMSTLADRGQDVAVTWDAYRDDDGWVVALRWQAGRSENRARWEIHAGQRTNNPAPQGRRRAGPDRSDPAAPHHRRPVMADVARQITEAAQVAGRRRTGAGAGLSSRGPEQHGDRPAQRPRPGTRRAAAGCWPTGSSRSNSSSRPCWTSAPPANRRNARRRPSAPAPTTPPPGRTERGTDRSCRAGRTSCSAVGRRPTSSRVAVRRVTCGRPGGSVSDRGTAQVRHRRCAVGVGLQSTGKPH